MSRILLVEDSRTQAAHLQLLLEEAGYTVELAPDAERALELFNASAFDMVVSDVVMPGQSGYDLCHLLRAHPTQSQVPVVLLTSLTDPLDILRGLECGADNYVTKPFEDEALLGRIRYIFASRARRASGRLKVGVEVAFLGQTFIVNSEKEQILDLLVATCEDVVRANRELRASREELARAHSEIATYARRMEGLARSSENRYRRLMEQAYDAIVLFDTLGRILEINRGAEELFGLSTTAATGRHFLEFVPVEEHQMKQAHFGQLLTEGHARRESHLRRTDGQVRDVDCTASLVDLGGERVVLCIIHDATERRRLEAQLRQAQKMEAVGRLAGGIAHDFNNLIQVVTGYGEMVLAALPSEHSQREAIVEMKKAGERAAALTRQLLAFSRKQVIAPQLLQLNTVIAEAGKMVRRLLGEDVVLAIVLEPALGLIQADPHQIEQVLVNLAINARDAMPTGGRLTVETSNAVLDDNSVRKRPEIKPGRYVLLAVSDTGHGMDEATKGHVFEPFFTTKAPGKGTGLGLAMVYGIVKQAGGFVYVYSEPGQGTAFKVYLPRVDEGTEGGHEARAGSALPAAGVPAADPPPSETLLLVEDEDAVRALTREVLGGAGYTILEAADGAEALLLCERHLGPIHLLLSDVVMPGMGGRELADRLSALRPGLKVLFLSGYADDAVVRHGVLASQVAFLQKPFSIESLTRKVREVLAGRNPGSAGGLLAPGAP